MSETIRQKMIDALASVKGKRMTAQRATICCPYHPDKTPSATINLSVDKPVPLGWFRCFGCRKSVSWNALASTLGLPKFGKGGKKNADDYLDPNRFKDEFLADTEQRDIGWEQEHKDMEFFDIQQEEWRTIPKALLERVGAKLCYLDRTGEFYVWLPCLVLGELKGYVKARLEKAPKGESSYFNASGTWSREYGLLFYDYALRVARRKGLNTIVLVEGPRDALRLLRFGIPAMAVLGAINFNEEKRYTLEQSGINNLAIFMDGDDAGRQATKVIRQCVKTHFNVVKVMKLWRDRVPRIDRKTGKQAFKKMADGKKKLLWDNELDPGNCPRSYLKVVRDSLV
jgi:DNA primase